MKNFFVQFIPANRFFPIVSRITEPCDMYGFDDYVTGFIFIGFYFGLIIGRKHTVIQGVWFPADDEQADNRMERN